MVYVKVVKNKAYFKRFQVKFSFFPDLVNSKPTGG